MPDTRDQRTASGSTPDQSRKIGDELAVKETGQKVDKRPVQENPYVFDENERSMFEGFDLNTPIARAWSRLGRSDRQHYLGKPTGNTEEIGGILKQDFQFSVGMMRVGDDNPNQVVQFFDGHGLLGQESGL